MSINPASDIVLDVIRAADPAKSRAAAEKLIQLDGAAEPAGVSFDQVLARPAIKASAEAPSAMPPPVSSASVRPPLDPRTKAYKGLEQLVLKNLVESMLPQETSSFFGSGTAGDIWRSLLADKLAAEMSRSVDLRLVSPKAPGSDHPSRLAQAPLAKDDGPQPAI